MKIDQQKSLLTAMAIMGTAFILFSMGCGSSKNVKPVSVAAQEQNLDKAPDKVIEANQTPIDQAKDPNKVKECTAGEYADLKSLKTMLADSDQQIKSLGDQKKWALNSKVLQSSQKSASLCEKLLARHRPAACKKTIADSIATVNSNKKIKAECELSQKYYIQFKTAQAPQPETPPVNPPTKQPESPVVAAPSVPQTPAPTVQQPQAPAGTYATCTAAEFQKLSTWSAELDSANKNIARLGGKSQWKYDSAANSTATAAKKSCEALISYHSQSPCQRSIKQADGSLLTKSYDELSMRQRCETARTYFYEFTQRTSTLNEKNADLYLDISRFNQKAFEPQEQKSYQNCVVQNPTDRRIDYSNQKALVISSRGFEDKIMVLETQEGLLLQCYSLGLDGPFSKRQVINNLNLDKTYINLEYVLK